MTRGKWRKNGCFLFFRSLGVRWRHAFAFRKRSCLEAPELAEELALRHTLRHRLRHMPDRAPEAHCRARISFAAVGRIGQQPVYAARGRNRMRAQ